MIQRRVWALIKHGRYTTTVYFSRPLLFSFSSSLWNQTDIGNERVIINSAIYHQAADFFFRLFYVHTSHQISCFSCSWVHMYHVSNRRNRDWVKFYTAIELDMKKRLISNLSIGTAMYQQLIEVRTTIATSWIYLKSNNDPEMHDILLFDFTLIVMPNGWLESLFFPLFSLGILFVERAF